MTFRKLKACLVAVASAACAACGESGPPPQESLALVVTGSGTGTVTSAPQGLSCTASCTVQFAQGTSVTLTAVAGATSTFTGWQGVGCTGTGTCVVALSEARSVTASFALRRQLTVNKLGVGTGSVTSAPAGVSCGADCSELFDENTEVTLTATPGAGSTFGGWSGACSGTGECTVTMSVNRSVTATFDTDIGPPAQIVVLSGAGQSAFAGTAPSQPIVIAVRDANGQGVPAQFVTFAVVAGNGTLANTSAVTGTDGTATVPQWTLGRSAEPQTLRATTAAVIEADILAGVTTAFNITLRFFGPAMTTEQEDLFRRAAARISGVVTGDLADVDARGGTADPSVCGVDGEPPLDEIIDDVLIYASVRAIDGPGSILGQAGPCFLRTVGAGGLTVVGSMEFDSADLGTLTGSGSLQDVITHEMLHVLGIGSLWDNKSLIVAEGTADPRYIGTVAINACRQRGGDVVCAVNLPAEDTGGAGTAGAHWRESKFNAEIMTGFLDSGANPFSLITIGGLGDLGYAVNNAAADPYNVFNNTALRAERRLLGADRVKRPVGTLDAGRVRWIIDRD